MLYFWKRFLIISSLAIPEYISFKTAFFDSTKKKKDSDSRQSLLSGSISSNPRQLSVPLMRSPLNSLRAIDTTIDFLKVISFRKEIFSLNSTFPFQPETPGLFAQAGTVLHLRLFSRLSLLELNVFLLTQLEEEGFFRSAKLARPSITGGDVSSSEESVDSTDANASPTYPSTLHLWVMKWDPLSSGQSDVHMLCPALANLLLYSIYMSHYFQLQVLKQPTADLRGKVIT
jgi:hypothetical protein